VFDFVDGAAEDEVTARLNRSAFQDLAFNARVLAGNGVRDLTTTVLGRTLSLPVITAPTGMTRMAGPEGERAAAVGADAVGTVSILSASPSVPMAEVAASVSSSQWLQIYLFHDQEMVFDRMRRAKELGFETLVVTADAPISGNRERDRRNRMAIPFRVTPRMFAGVVTKPRWLFDYLTGPPLVDDGGNTASVVSKIAPGTDRSIANVMKGMFNPDQDWDDLKRIRDLWDGPLVLKGVMCAEDARLAVEAGCEGVVVSNHGGRQLDGLPATIEVLPEVVAEVGAEVDVLIDSGIRRGQDVVKALALGAKACLIGRPWVFGMTNGGSAGVERVLNTFAEEIDRVMALVGVRSVADLTPAILRRRTNAGWSRL